MHSMPRYHPAGDNALLVEFGEGVSGQALALSADAARSLRDVEGCTVGHSSLYVLFRTNPVSGVPESLRAILSEVRSKHVLRDRREHHLRVSVHPDAAPDLALLMQASGKSREEIVHEMRELHLTVRYSGFRPGFAYLEGIPSAWHLPRHPRVRATVPAGSLAVAGTMGAFYPGASPGGWNLIGRTDSVLWDPARIPPNLLAAGDAVRIEPVEEMLAPAVRVEVERPIDGEIVATVTAPGQSAVIVAACDSNRLQYGLPPSGPFDAGASRAANQAVGNDPEAPVLECAMVGPSLRFCRSALLSWSGSSADVAVSGVFARDVRQLAVEEGDLVEIGRINEGLRGVLAIRGGLIDPNPPLAVEPGRVKAGDPLRVGEKRGDRTRLTDPALADRTRIRVRRGPHEIPDALFDRLKHGEWSVTNDLNRIGIRIAGSTATTGIPGDLPSCGMQFGTVQWHPGGDLVVMGPDHPVTGGYLQPMTVLVRERWKLARLTPGDRVTWIDE